MRAITSGSFRSQRSTGGTLAKEGRGASRARGRSGRRRARPAPSYQHSCCPASTRSQKPLTQSVPSVQPWPLTSLQAPAALQALFAGQLPVAPVPSSAQVPPAHVLQGPVQAVEQQKLSTPVEQSPL